MQLKCNIIKNLLDSSFKEDFGIKGDITSDSVIDKQANRMNPDNMSSGI